MDTTLVDAGATPERLDSPANALGNPGQRAFIINTGDDSAHLLIAATRPTGQPGFPVRRGQRVELSLPDGATNGLWCWSAGRTRLVISTYADDIGAVPGRTGIITIGSTPIQIPDPAGASAGDSYLAYNAGGGEVLTVQAPTTPSPDTGAGGVPLGVGESLALTAGEPGAVSSVWAWSATGAVLLLSLADERWRV